MSDRLGHKQTAAMFALMVTARAVSNPELETIAGFRLDGKARTELNELDLVASHKEGRCFVHELTEQGWKWCGGELAHGTPPQPSPHSTLASTLYVVLEGLGGFLRREQLSLFDVFAVRPEAPAEPTAGAETAGPEPTRLSPARIEERILAAYTGLAREPRAWVGLVDLRPKLAGVPTEAVDAVLKELSRTGRASLVPDSNRKALKAADHEAAIRIGGEENHLISIEVS